MICCTLLRRMDGVDTDNLLAESYRQVLKRDAYNERALRGLARLLFKVHDYQGTLDVYERLLELKPDHRNFLLNKAVCLGRLQRYDEALKILYKMDYEQADDLNVKRVLAWTLVGSGKLEQAGKAYAQILEASQPEGDDLLNYGLCQWLSGDVVGAIGLFRQYAETCGDQGFDAEAVFCREEAPLLKSNGISDVEIRMMIDTIDH
jgi:tetratricopeptide (TPR) repeat protein